MPRPMRPRTPSKNFDKDSWRVCLGVAGLWPEAINRRGGNATLVHLPAIGIRGTTHFPFSDLNNGQICCRHPW
jgi:hypothetical protein